MNNSFPISASNAEDILRKWLGKPAACMAIGRLHGGMIYPVLELEFDQPPHKAVIKVSPEDSFKCEAFLLKYLKMNTRFPVPEVYLQGAPGELVEPGFLLIERLPGVNLGEAEMTPGERRNFDFQLAEILLELHSHTADRYGGFFESENCPGWLDWFQPLIYELWEDSRLKLTQRSLELIPGLLDKLPQVFVSPGAPTLVHGDLWATNVIVDRSKAGWAVTGFVDPACIYADVEYELAYLEVFDTVTRAFFERYNRERPMRTGYETRRLYYWLNTMMLHVWLFGDDHYIRRTEHIAEELSSLLKG